MEKFLFLTAIFLPLFGFFFLKLTPPFIAKKYLGWIATSIIALSFFGLCIAYLVSPVGAIFVLSPWIDSLGFKAQFSFQLGALSRAMGMIVFGVGSLVHLYSIGYMHEDEQQGNFFAYLNLFVFFMAVLVFSSNLIGLFVGWEGVGLSSYLLIGFWWKEPQNVRAAEKAFLINRIGDMGLILGILMVAFLARSTEYATILHQLPLFASHPLLPMAALLLFVGCIGKSAQWPLLTWLPDAMVGPTPVSALMHAATMVTAGIYLLVQLAPIFESSVMVMHTILVIGCVTAFFGACMAFAQEDIKKILAYSTISQLGIMVVAIGLHAFKGAFFHLTTHAFFKALLFLAAGSVIHATGERQLITEMGGLWRRIPITTGCFLVGLLALVGCPPFSGFFSKDTILTTAFYQAPFVFFVLIAVTILTNLYMIRVFYRVFLGKTQDNTSVHESGFLMLIPMIILALLSLFGGIAMPYSLHMDGLFWALFLFSLGVLGIFGCLLYRRYTTQYDPAIGSRYFKKIHHFFHEGAYLDRGYRVCGVGAIYLVIDKVLVRVDGVLACWVLMPGKILSWISRCWHQQVSGNMRVYIAAIVIALLVMIFSLRGVL